MPSRVSSATMTNHHRVTGWGRRHATNDATPTGPLHDPDLADPGGRRRRRVLGLGSRHGPNRGPDRTPGAGTVAVTIGRPDSDRRAIAIICGARPGQGRRP